MTDVPIVVLTALDLEYQAVQARMTDLRTHRHEAGTSYEIGYLSGGCRVALGLVSAGNHPAAVLAERAIAEFSPTALLFVGIAGALWDHVGLGDVVVANRVYAYHGATSQDDGLKARPRSWELAHDAEQVARRLARSLRADGSPLVVRFGPIAAGEVVQDSADSDQARWLRDVYNDAVAVEMEGAGVAQAGHLNRSLPVVVVRGISDRADGTKARTDGVGWQEKAAENAAAFATALAEQLARELPPRTPVRAAEGNGAPVGDHTTNIARGNARVWIQTGRIDGPVIIGAAPPTADLTSGLLDLRQRLRKAHAAGEVDEGTYAAAMRELDVATAATPPSDPRRRSTVTVSLKMLRGLLMDVDDLSTTVNALLATMRAAP